MPVNGAAHPAAEVRTSFGNWLAARHELDETVGRLLDTPGRWRSWGAVQELRETESRAWQQFIHIWTSAIDS